MATDCFDIQELAILLANMLEGALQSGDELFEIKEVDHGQQDSGKTPTETGVHLFTPIEYDSSPSQPGEHRTPIWPERQSHGDGMAGEQDLPTGSRVSL